MPFFFPAPSIMVEFSLSIIIRLARPNMSKETFSNLMPTSSEITWPPVNTAMSSNMALRRSPNPGAFTAAIFKPPRSLFTTRVAKASPSMSSAIIRSGWLDLTTDSRIGSNDCKLDNFFSWIKMYGSSSSQFIFSGFVMK